MGSIQQGTQILYHRVVHLKLHNAIYQCYPNKFSNNIYNLKIHIILNE